MSSDLAPPALDPARACMNLTHGRGALPLVLVGVFYCLALFSAARAILDPPTITIVVRSGNQSRIAWVLPGGNLWSMGIRPGDAVLRLDGHPPIGSGGEWVGRRAEVRMAGRVQMADAAAIEQAAPALPLLVISPWFLLFGALIYLRAPRRDIGWSAFALFAGASLALALAPATDTDDLIAKAGEYVAVPLFGACFALFFTRYPRLHGPTRLPHALLGVALLAALFGIAGLCIPRLYSLSDPLWLGTVLTCLLAGIGLLGGALRTSRDGETRRGLTIITLGTVTAVAPFISLSLAPLILGRAPVLAAEHAILALAIMPASFAYAITRHQALRVSLMQRWAVYAIGWALLLLLYGAAITLLDQALGIATPGVERAVALIALVAALATLSLRRLHEHMRHALDRLVFKDGYDYRASLRRLSRDLSTTGDLATLTDSLPRTLRRLMNLRFAMLLARGAPAPLACAAVGDRPPNLLAIADACEKVWDEPRAVPLAEGSGAVLAIPLRTQDEMIGHLCLGPKLSGEPFRAEDRALLATLSGHLAAIIRNAQLVDMLQRQVAALDALNASLQRAREEERSRLAAEIHDEPLQTAIHLRRQIAAYGDGGVPTTQHLALSESLIGQIRSICLAVRPAALDEFGLSAALELLILNLGEHVDIPILLDADPGLVDLPLPSEVEVVLYRAAQEALNNALRHAQPTKLQIALRHGTHGVCLQVMDEGLGFALPTHLDGLAAAGHLGLSGLHRRVQRAGGSLTIRSTPGVGTLMQVRFPLDVAVS